LKIQQIRCQVKAQPTPTQSKETAKLDFGKTKTSTIARAMRFTLPAFQLRLYDGKLSANESTPEFVIKMFEPKLNWFNHGFA